MSEVAKAPTYIAAMLNRLFMLCGRYFHFRHAMLGYVVLILVGFVFMFWLATCTAYARLNYQRR